MSDDLLTTLRFEVDGSGVATGLTSVKRSITDLGNAVKDITDKTNAALGKVGTEELPVAKGLEKASKSIIKQTGDIEKAIATFGSTASTSLKQAYKDINAEEVRLRGMGIDAAIMNPYLEKLREVQKLTAAVAAQERTLAQGAAQAVEAENQRLAHTLELKRQIASVKTTVDNNNAAAQAAKQAEIEAQQKFKLLSLNNQIQASNKATADAQAAQSAKAIKDLKDLTAAQAAYRQEVINSELNFTHTGRGKSTAFLADKGQRLGFDSSFIEKELAGYKKVEDAAKAAFQAANPHIAEMSKRAADAGTSVKGLSASMRNVPAQFTDIIVSLQGGQAPLTVLLQQGGQLKDMFGGVGNAARALGGYVVDLINPFTVAAGVVGSLAYVAYKASEDTKAFGKALAETGNRSGASVGQLKDMATAIGATGIGASAASDALTKFVGAGVQAGDNLRSFTQSAIDLERNGGQAVEETAKKFAELAKEPLSATLKLNDGLGYVTQSLYEQIKALERSGDAAGAAALAQGAYEQAIKQQNAALESQRGPIDTATRYWADFFNGIVDGARFATSAILGIPDTGSQQNAKDRAKLAEYEKYYGQNDKDVIALKEKIRIYDYLTAAQKASTQAEKDRQEVLKLSAKYDASDFSNDKLAQRNLLVAENTRLLDAGMISKERYNKRIEDFDKTVKVAESEYDKLIKKLGSELPKAAAEAEAAQQGYNKAQTEFIALVGGDSWGKFTNDQRATVAALYERKIASEQSEAATKALAKAEQEAAKDQADYMEKLGNAGAKEVSALETRLQKQTQHNAEIGKTAEQTEAVRRVAEEAATAELESQAKAIQLLLDKEGGLVDLANTQYTVSEAAKPIYELELKNLRDQIALRKQIAKGYGEGEQKEASAAAAKEAKKAAKDAAKEWQKTADKINDSITDALMRGFESGKGFAKNLRDSVVNMFKTMVLRPVVQATVGGTLGVLGMNAAAQSADSGGGGGLLNTASDLKALYGMKDWFTDFGSAAASSVIRGGEIAYSAGFEKIGSSMMSVSEAGNFAAVSDGLNTLGSGLSYFSAAVSASQGKWGSAAGTVIGTAFGGPLGGAVGSFLGGLVDNIFGGDGGPKLASTGDAIRRYDKGGALTENATNGAWFFTNTQDANKLLDGLESRYQKAAKALGIGTVATQFDYGSNNRGNFALAGAAGNSRANTGEIAYSAEAMQVAASRAVFAALQGSELPKYLSGLLDSVGDINAMSQAQIDDILNTAQAFKGLHDVMAQMPFEALHDLSYNAAKGLIEFSGGLDKLTQNLGTYYDNFYSAEEKKAQTLANITKTLTDAGALTKTTRTAIPGEFDLTTGPTGMSVLQWQRYATSIENIDMPKTREEFRALVESMRDLGGEASQKAYAALLSVSGAFASVTPAANDAVAATEKATAATEKATAAAEKAAATQRAIADAQQSITLSKNTLAGVSSQDNAVVAAKFALQSVIDAITDLGKSVTKDAAYQVTKAQIESVNLSEFAGTEYGAALSELVADYWAAQVQLKEANDAVTAAANQTSVAQTSVADTAMSATAAVATLAEQLGRFGSGLNLRFDLAAGGNKSAAFNTDYLRDIVAHQDQNTANVQSAVAGDPSNTWAQQMLTEAQIAGLTNKVYAAGAAAARLREFFVQMSTEAVNIEQAIADSGTAIGKGVQAVNLSEYFTAFSADLTEAIGVINGAIAGGADAIADSATILASVTTDSSRSYVQAMLDNLAAGLDAVDAADLGTMAEAAGGATKIATAITQSVLNSVSEEVKNNPALSGLAGTDQAYISAIVSGVGQNDIQGINDAFLLLSGALTSGRLDAIEYNAAIDLVTKGFLSGANAAEIALQAASFADRLAIATGSKTQLEISRKNELATALDDGNKATLLAIYAAEDLVTAREKDAASATKAAQEASTNATEALAGVQRAVDAQKKLAQVQVDVAQESVANLTSIFDTLKSSVAQLYGSVDSTAAQSAAKGSAFIAQALATAKATGYFPDADDLADAVAAATQGVSGGVYASKAEADFARLSLAGSLSGLKDITGTQLTAAEQALKVAQDQLTTLDKTLETASEQLDADNGINTSVLSVADALDLLNTSIADLIAANSAKALADAASTRSTGAPMAPDVVPPAHRGTIYEATTGLTALYGPAYLNRLGGTLPDLYAAAKAAGLPGFASGINRVPYDMQAIIHKDEAVVPAAFNPFNPNAQGAGNARLETLVEGLTAEVQRLQTIVNDGNRHQRRTADAVNGNPEMPMLVETV